MVSSYPAVPVSSGCHDVVAYPQPPVIDPNQQQVIPPTGPDVTKQPLDKPAGVQQIPATPDKPGDAVPPAADTPPPGTPMPDPAAQQIPATPDKPKDM